MKQKRVQSNALCKSSCLIILPKIHAELDKKSFNVCGSSFLKSFSTWFNIAKQTLMATLFSEDLSETLADSLCIIQFVPT